MRLKALADPIRVKPLFTSDPGEVCSCDLPQAVGLGESTVRHHLSQGLLRDVPAGPPFEMGTRLSHFGNGAANLCSTQRRLPCRGATSLQLQAAGFPA